MKLFNTKNELEALENLGLSQKEALIYLSALDLGGGTVSEIAANGEIERTGIYYHIDKLIRDGLLRTATRGKRTFYLPTDPENLKAIVKQKEKNINSILPKLAEQFAIKTGKSIIEYYQGESEVARFYNRVYQILEALRPPNNLVYIFGQSYKAVTGANKIFLNFTPHPEQIDIKIRTIMSKSQKSNQPDGNAGDPYIVTRYNLPRSEIKFIDDKYAYSSAIVLAGDYVILFDPKILFYSITKSSSLSQTLSMFFEFTWDRLPK